MKELPTDPDKLRALYLKLKDREARLEADLAIKENPELEMPIKAIVLALSDVRQLEKIKSNIERPSDLDREKVKNLRLQIDHYENKLAALRDVYNSLTGGDRAEKVRVQLDEAIEDFKNVYSVYATELTDSGVRLAELIPAIATYVGKS